MYSSRSVHSPDTYLSLSLNTKMEVLKIFTAYSLSSFPIDKQQINDVWCLLNWCITVDDKTTKEWITDGVLATHHDQESSTFGVVYISFFASTKATYRRGQGRMRKLSATYSSYCMMTGTYHRFQLRIRYLVAWIKSFESWDLTPISSSTDQ